MNISTEKIEDVLVIHVIGRIDHKTAKDFEDGMAPYLDICVAGECEKILIDLGGVDFMTSAGLRVLMIFSDRCEKLRCKIWKFQKQKRNFKIPRRIARRWILSSNSRSG